MDVAERWEPAIGAEAARQLRRSARLTQVLGTVILVLGVVYTFVADTMAAADLWTATFCIVAVVAALIVLARSRARLAGRLSERLGTEVTWWELPIRTSAFDAWFRARVPG
ncbi:MAG TPA: hypothetical protein VFJ85_08275 [Acidimicrobiales bacterium]|nr:hypothetical protein [Acidimicrobiales bacterium]